MAAQSAGESVKVQPFYARLACAELYSTSSRLAAWTLHFLCAFAGPSGSLRNWRACCPPGKHAIDQLPVFDDCDAVDENELNSFRILQRLFERSFVDYPGGVEHGDVRIRTDANSSFVLEHGGALLQPLRGHQRH